MEFLPENPSEAPCFLIFGPVCPRGEWDRILFGETFISEPPEGGEMDHVQAEFLSEFLRRGRVALMAATACAGLSEGLFQTLEFSFIKFRKSADGFYSEERLPFDFTPIGGSMTGGDECETCFRGENGDAVWSDGGEPCFQADA